VSAFAQPAAALRVETAKLGEQLALRVLLAACVLAPLGFALVMRIQSTVPADTLFGRWAATTGFATSLTVLGFAGTFALPVVAGIIAGDLFASEDRYGTWKTILTRSSTRADVFAGKAVAAAGCTVLAVGALALSSLVSGVLLVGSSPLVGLSGQLVPSGRASVLVLVSWASTLLPTLAYVALGLLLSITSRSAIVGVLGPAVVGVSMQLLSLVGPGEIVRVLLPSTPFEAWHGLFVEPAHIGPLVQGQLTSLVFIAVLLSVAWAIVRRRAFAGSESVPARRWQGPLRTALAFAAVVAVLVAVSGLGPTELTAGRLDASVTATFQRLILLRDTWRAHHPDPPGALVRVQSQCSRSSGRPDGPGEDWACVLTLPQQVTATSMTLDVSLHANGCYTADAPPTAVGSVRLIDNFGRPFTNPLYAFDGCLGTA
jgi:ABC-2 type transport system permease protein